MKADTLDEIIALAKQALAENKSLILRLAAAEYECRRAVEERDALTEQLAACELACRSRKSLTDYQLKVIDDWKAKYESLLAAQNTTNGN